MASRGAAGRRRPPPVGGETVIERQKRAAGTAAAALVEEGMRLGLGTGTTVAYLLPALAARKLNGLRCAATSPATASLASELGFQLDDLDELGELDLAIDGADQIDPQGWLIKGGGGAHTREKIVAAAARSFVVIASAEKAVPRLEPPVPLELLRFGMRTTLRELGAARLRERDGRVLESPDGGLIGDYLGAIEDPLQTAARLAARPGVIEHGLFEPELVSLILVAREDGVERRTGAKREA
jgi:ribose 5-phosphate isomerase A